MNAPAIIAPAILLAASAIALVVAYAPIGLDIRIGLMLCAGMLPTLGLLMPQSLRENGSDRFGRAVVAMWLFLVGACPFYLYYRIGPLRGLNPLRAAYLAMFVIWAFDLSSKRYLRDRLMSNVRGAKIGTAALMVWLLWQLVCSWVSDEPLHSISIVMGAAVGPTAVFFVAATYFRGSRDLSASALALVLGAVVACSVALLEWHRSENVFVGLFPTDQDQLEALRWITEHRFRGGQYRVSGTYSHPLALGEYLCMVLPFSFFLAKESGQSWRRSLGLLSIPLFFAVVVLTHTRSSLIVASAEVMLGAVWLVRGSGANVGGELRKIIAGLVAVCAIVLIALKWSAVVTVIAGQNRAEIGSSAVRIDMLLAGIHAVAKHPIAGYGPGTAAWLLGFGPDERHLTIDSYYVSCLVETGIVGLLLFVMAVVAPILGTAARWSTMPIQSRQLFLAAAVAVAGSLTVKTILSLTDNFNLLYFILALCVTARTRSDGEFATGRAASLPTSLRTQKNMPEGIVRAAGSA